MYKEWPSITPNNLYVKVIQPYHFEDGYNWMLNYQSENNEFCYIASGRKYGTIEQITIQATAIANMIGCELIIQEDDNEG